MPDAKSGIPETSHQIPNTKYLMPHTTGSDRVRQRSPPAEFSSWSAFVSGVSRGVRYARIDLGCAMGISGYSVCRDFGMVDRPGRYGDYRFGNDHISLPFDLPPFGLPFLVPCAILSFLPLNRDFF